MTDHSDEIPKLISGIGEKKSNGGTQWFNQDRIYSSETVSVLIATCCHPYFLVVIDEKNKGN